MFRWAGVEKMEVGSKKASLTPNSLGFRWGRVTRVDSEEGLIGGGE